ncbi:pterin-4-alpha-carbinolamine dehydratase 2, mitochondrial isoform X2 [Malania oleifera]|uniref:pterin-4-alpha-carbinolamine dehydratase 2, mitochondrial isoform X2 n=1 Tax=Malania oleifera TaxID=397392 RepID=UPI0025AE54EC|nr:pterin-4-alpha-carbinolamine dehydratase 2, mitochondrial isoform X2 [Malania oleifera]
MTSILQCQQRGIQYELMGRDRVWRETGAYRFAVPSFIAEERSSHTLLDLSMTAPMLQIRLLPLSKSLFGAHGRSSTQVSGILGEHLEVSSYRNSPCGFRTFCTNKDLSIKKCVPCNSKDLRPMTKQAADELILKVPGWNLVDEGGSLKLSQSLKVKSFIKGLELFQLVAEVAEAEGHHPDLHLVGWNNIIIEIWTHAIGGLTENDFILAAKINRVQLKHLLRHKVTP